MKSNSPGDLRTGWNSISKCRLVSSIVYDAYRDDRPDDVVMGVDAVVDGRRT